MRPLLCAAFGALALLGLTACGSSSGGSGAAKTAAITIESFQFKPNPLTVKPGTKVTWTNQDALHSIKDQSDLHTPESPQLAKGDTFSITYEKAGTYPYICGIHNYMAGSVVVTG
jgi:plastocyanin